jgi:hypothetical protein
MDRGRERAPTLVGESQWTEAHREEYEKFLLDTLSLANPVTSNISTETENQPEGVEESGEAREASLELARGSQSCHTEAAGDFTGLWPPPWTKGNIRMLTRHKLVVSASDDKAATVTYGQYCGFRCSRICKNTAAFTSAHRQNCYKNCYTDFRIFRKCHDPNGIRTRVTAVKGRKL